jgi:uncharacterized protein (DUF1697 family)
MTAYIALLRAVNVGGSGKLPMAELVAMCEACCFARVRTYIASGNAVFDFKGSASHVKALLESRLAACAGRPVGVLVRTAAEMNEVLRANPFPNAAQNRVVAIFLDAPPPADALDHVAGHAREQLQLGAREIFVHYADGIGESKLKIPAAKTGTARNMNTVAKLAAMAAQS